jgi:hypothetical protein
LTENLFIEAYNNLKLLWNYGSVERRNYAKN